MNRLSIPVRLFWIGLTILNISCVSQPLPEAVDIVLDPSKTYQTMTGWEGTHQSGEEACQSFDLYQDQLFDLLVNDLGITRVRVEIFALTENPIDYIGQQMRGEISFADAVAHWDEVINDNQDPNVINWDGFHFTRVDNIIDKVVLPMKQRLEANDEKLFINMNFVKFRKSAYEFKEHPQEYAEFVLATYLHMQTKYGFVPDGWEVILEPDNAKWSPEQIGAAIAASASILKAHGFQPYFIAPSTTSMTNAWQYFDHIILVPGVQPNLREISYHRYAGVTEESLRAIASRAEQYDIGAGMLEIGPINYDVLHEDLKIGRNTVWAQYTLAWCDKDRKGSYYYGIDESNPGKPVIYEPPQTKYFRQYFHFIRPGAQRIEATSGKVEFDPLAFINKNGGYVVVVKADSGGNFTIGGLPAGRYGLVYTTDKESRVELPEVNLKAGQGLQGSIPAKGVITIYALQPASSASGFPRAF
jgi:hypothetical protein